MYKTLTINPNLDIAKLLHCYQKYMEFVVENPPTQKMFIENMEIKNARH